MNRAIFLDRDGVINEDLGYVYKPQEFRFIDGIFEFCGIAQELGYLLIIITNQAGIGRGYCTEEDFHNLNRWMLAEFMKHGVDITATYHCPYHPEHGVGIYKCDSFDRKPNPGMILKARDKFDIDLSRSLLIGDKDTDIEAGRRAGIGNLLFLIGKYQPTSTDDVTVTNSLYDIKL